MNASRTDSQSSEDSENGETATSSSKGRVSKMVTLFSEGVRKLTKRTFGTSNRKGSLLNLCDNNSQEDENMSKSDFDENGENQQTITVKPTTTVPKMDCISDNTCKHFDLDSSTISDVVICNGDRKNSFVNSKEIINASLSIPKCDQKTESTRRMFGQIAFPFLCAGLGNVAAGILLDIVQYWTPFQDVAALSVLVPALLGLKGNLEMTMASRLSTLANLGSIDSPRELWKIVWGNMALIQCQATAVSFLASIFAVVMNFANVGQFSSSHALFLCASSLITANIASFALGLLLAGVIIFSHRHGINPDNVAAPVAASLGDVVSLGLLSVISSGLYVLNHFYTWVLGVIIILLLILSILWGYLAFKNEYTKTILYTGWLPIILAMIISSGGGYILDYAMTNFTGVAVFQPVINGVGGNLVAIQASRMSTYLHNQKNRIIEIEKPSSLCIMPHNAFVGKGIHCKTARVLLLLAIPGHILFTLVIYLIDRHSFVPTPTFSSLYMVSAMFQVCTLLYFAHILVHWLWKRKIDPDNSAIPILTAMGDLLGSAILMGVFFIACHLGDPNGTN